jgi:hypothetical protein
MPTAKELIETAARTAPSAKMPSDGTAALAKKIARDSLDPKSGLTLPAKMPKAGAART